MVANETFRNLARSFPDATEMPHFERASFRVGNKIFATLSELQEIANFKLSPTDQMFFCSISPEIIFPVANKWGQHGWTSVKLAAIGLELLHEITSSAYHLVVRKK